MPSTPRLRIAPAVADGLIAIACGLGFFWLADGKLGRVHMLDAWNTADMVDYCNAILHLGADPDTPWAMKRSKCN